MKTSHLLFILLLLLSACSQKTTEIELVIDAKAKLGEGAIWNQETREFWWVNIVQNELHLYSPETGKDRVLEMGEMIGTVVPSVNGKATVALKSGIYSVDTESGAKTLICRPEADIPTNRFNDGKCDPAGRLWAGTMPLDGSKKTAALYRIDADGSYHQMIDSVTISNGIVWSHDKKTMYYIDTPTKRVMAYSYNDETGEIWDPRIAIVIPRPWGAPDGMTIDENGNLWIALWGGACVTCWNPETRSLVKKIDVPAKNVTSCAFGDSDLKTLYITTARQGTSDADLEKYPLSGGVFKIRPGEKGVNAFFYKGEF
jgi:sugar lactone lactonase YvrE